MACICPHGSRLRPQVAGGVVLDRVGSSIPNACRLCAWAVAAGGVFCALSFAAARNLLQFAPLFAAGELGLFAIQVPSSTPPCPTFLLRDTGSSLLWSMYPQLSICITCVREVI